MSKWSAAFLILLSFSSVATPLPHLDFSLASLQPTYQSSTYRLFLSSSSLPSANLAVNNIDGGYTYNLFGDIDVYIGARLTSSPIESSTQFQTENGLLSGISYQVSPTISVSSSIHSYKSNLDTESDSTLISAEISSRINISEHLDIHATVDYQDVQQGVEVGLGFRF